MNIYKYILIYWILLCTTNDMTLHP